MPPFEKPSASRRRDGIWVRNAQSKDFAPPDYPWDRLWRFNTMSIPILDEVTFWDEALSAARVAEDHRQLEKLMAQKLDERRKEFTSRLLSINYAILRRQGNIRSSTGRTIADRVCSTGSLENFLQFLAGSVFEWEEEAKNEQARIETASKEDGFHGPFQELEPDYIWTQYGSEGECSFAERHGTYSSLSEDGTEAATATAIGTPDQNKHLEPPIMAPRDDALDGLHTRSSVPALLPSQSRATIAQLQTNDTVHPVSLEATHEDIAEAQIAQPAVSSIQAVEHEPAPQDTPAISARPTEDAENGPSRNDEFSKRLRLGNGYSNVSKDGSHENIHGSLDRKPTEDYCGDRAFQSFPLLSNKRPLYTESDRNDSCDNAEQNGNHRKRCRRA